MNNLHYHRLYNNDDYTFVSNLAAQQYGQNTEEHLSVMIAFQEVCIALAENNKAKKATPHWDKILTHQPNKELMISMMQVSEKFCQPQI